MASTEAQPTENVSTTTETADSTSPPPEIKPKPPKRRRGRDYSVHVGGSGVRSTTKHTKSTPKAAAMRASRNCLMSMELNEPHKIWVKSATKYHPYTVTRKYDNPKFRKFTLEKAGNPISHSLAKDPMYQIPTDLL